jgi:hypothetical protein
VELVHESEHFDVDGEGGTDGTGREVTKGHKVGGDRAGADRANVDAPKLYAHHVDLVNKRGAGTRPGITVDLAEVIR